MVWGELLLPGDCGTPFWSSRPNSKLRQEWKKEVREWDNDLGIFKSKMKIAKVTGEGEII